MIPYQSVLYLLLMYPKINPNGKIQINDINEKWISAKIKAVATMVIRSLTTFCKLLNKKPLNPNSSNIGGKIAVNRIAHSKG